MLLDYTFKKAIVSILACVRMCGSVCVCVREHKTGVSVIVLRYFRCDKYDGTLQLKTTT